MTTALRPLSVATFNSLFEMRRGGRLKPVAVPLPTPFNSLFEMRPRGAWQQNPRAEGAFNSLFEMRR